MKRSELEVFAWGMMEAVRQYAEADKERPQAEDEDNPFLTEPINDTETPKEHSAAVPCVSGP